MIALAVGAAGACGGDGNGDGIDVREAWARPSPAGVDVGAVYLTLRAGRDDSLVSAAVAPEIADTATIHETVDAGSGMMSMREIDALPLPGGEQVVIEPGGTHVMLDGLADPLAAGTTFVLTLDFAESETVTVDVSVGDEPG